MIISICRLTHLLRKLMCVCVCACGLPVVVHTCTCSTTARGGLGLCTKLHVLELQRLECTSVSAVASELSWGCILLCCTVHVAFVNVMCATFSLLMKGFSIACQCWGGEGWRERGEGEGWRERGGG